MSAETHAGHVRGASVGVDPADSRPPGRRTLAEGLSRHDNSLGVIRLVLAALVIFSHAFPLGGWGDDPFLALTRGQENMGGIAVLGFFAISGYLITKSGARSDVVQYFWHRFLRIFPAFWAVLLVGALAVGPIVWLLDGNEIVEYFSQLPDGPLSYLTGNANLSMGQYGIYDVFVTTTPWGERTGTSVLNGSLWTLSYEWICYLIIGVLVAAAVLTRARVLVPILTGIFFVFQVIRFAIPGGLADTMPYLADGYRVGLPLVFLVGACFAIYSNSVPLDDRLGILSGIVVALTLWNGGFAIIGYPALAYFVLWLAARLPKSFQPVGRRNDYSYGIYLYGWLVEQVLAYFGTQHLGYFLYALAALAVAGGCAWISWHCIEKPALSLKDWGPGRGVRHWVTRLHGAWDRIISAKQRKARQ